MKIPFIKAHGARNDFLLTWAESAPPGDRRAVARAICDRYSGVGADGWLLVTRGGDGVDGSIQLFNSDGSDSEISGNGTRCAAAFLLESGVDAGELRIGTGAGVKHLKSISRRGFQFEFEMNMGTLREVAKDVVLQLKTGPRKVTTLNVGNPQCVVFTDDFEFDWRVMGKELEWHAHFPNRTNVSFVRVKNRNRIEIRIWERGAGETMSSGTGSTGAAAASILHGYVESPVEVCTPAGILPIRWQEDLFLTGPAEIVAGGEFYWE